MKKLLLLFALSIISTTTFSQKNQSRNSHNFNFDNENKKIYWQKVYENGSYEEVQRFITDMGCVINHNDSTRISGSTPMNNLRIPKKIIRSGEDYYGDPQRMIYYTPCVIYFSIDIKDNKYRVTATNIIWTSTMYFNMYYAAYNPGKLDINSILIRKNGKLRKMADKVDFVILDKCLDKVFDINKNAINIVEKEW